MASETVASSKLEDRSGTQLALPPGPFAGRDPARGSNEKADLLLAGDVERARKLFEAAIKLA